MSNFNDFEDVISENGSNNCKFCTDDRINPCKNCSHEDCICCGKK